MPSRRAVPSIAVVVALLAVAAFAGPATAGPRPHHAPLPGGCLTVFPASNVWNKRIDSLPVRSDSAALIAFMGSAVGLHPDFGTFAGYGTP